MSKYLEFEYPPEPLLRKNVASGLGIIVKSKKHGDILGFIQYFPRWKQDIFIPNGGTAWSWDCLEDIVAELKKRNEPKP